MVFFLLQSTEYFQYLLNLKTQVFITVKPRVNVGK